MQTIFSAARMRRLAFAVGIGAFALTAGIATAAESRVPLSGAEETPPVYTAAQGSGTIKVDADKSISGSITTSGVNATAAHIHLAEPGKSGPPVITLDKTSDGVWSVPAGAKLSDEQHASYQAGNLYINVHSAENKRGEIRGQIKP